ncbi:MAG: hypothetical protein ACOC7Y_02500 [Chloroflexota bacterium]
MKEQTSQHRLRAALWVIIGLAVLGTVVLLFLLLSMAAGPAHETQAPTAASISATPEPNPSPSAPPSGASQAATSPLGQSPVPTPNPGPGLPTVAPDFTLERAGGGTFALAEQLEQGPVVLVFFERCG